VHGLKISEAQVSKIVLDWPHIETASDYKVYWNVGIAEDSNILQILTLSTNQLNHFVVDSKNSNGVVGGDFLRSNGGTFKFRVSYIDAKSGKESELSKVESVTIAPDSSKKVKIDPSNSDTLQIHKVPSTVIN
jgi:hypothetical protein